MTDQNPLHQKTAALCEHIDDVLEEVTGHRPEYDPETIEEKRKALHERAVERRKSQDRA